jgi:hypothetical protein
LAGALEYNRAPDDRCGAYGIEHARDNLREALELFFESASASEVKQRLSGGIYVTQLEVVVG